MQLFRITAASAYVWVFGCTITLVAIGMTVTTGTSEENVLALGTLLMFTGLAMSVVESMFDTVARFRQVRAESNGGESSR